MMTPLEPVDLDSIPPPPPGLGRRQMSVVTSDQMYDEPPNNFDGPPRNFDVRRVADGDMFFHDAVAVLDMSVEMASLTENNDAPESTILLDETGSMLELGQEPLQAANAYIEDQSRNGVPGSRVSLVLFNDRVKVVYRSKLATEATPLDAATYRPDGMTALFDALRFVILTASKPQYAVIITDGKDNTSLTRTAEINALIDRAKLAGWQFRFVGCNQMAREQAAAMPVQDVTMEGVPEGQDAPPLPTILMRESSNTTDMWLRRTSSVTG
jgi:hypothetical protein